MRFKLHVLLAILLGLTSCMQELSPGEIKHWAIYYDDELPAKTFEEMDLIVLDRVYHLDFNELKPKTVVLAYVSIGEMHDDAPEKKELKDKKLLLYQHDVWKSHAVDLTSPIWRKLVLDKVNDAKKRGFDGVMLDTVESPIHWAETHAPERAQEMREAAVALIQDIRAAHPKMKIMLNRGFALLPRIYGEIDYVLAESILANTDVSAGHFRLFPTNTYAQAAEQLRYVASLAPHLQILTLDYWNQDDGEGIEQIYATHREHGFVPYVTTPDLRRYTPEPSNHDS